jgi:hypothetical protein
VRSVGRCVVLVLRTIWVDLGSRLYLRLATLAFLRASFFLSSFKSESFVSRVMIVFAYLLPIVKKRRGRGGGERFASA